MDKNNLFTKILAIVGDGLLWLPLLAPGVFSILRLTRGGDFRFDYLMPAELFPVILVGGGLLLWAALRAGAYRKLIGWSLGTAVGILVAGQVLASVSGLASGRIEAEGLWWALVIASLGLYVLAVIALAVGGALLVSQLFKNRPVVPET